MFCRPQFAVVLLLGCFSLPAALLGQSAGACRVPTPRDPAAGKNLLTPGQEARFSEIVSEQLEWSERPFSDPRITDYPGAVLSRLLENLPASARLHPQIRFYDAAFPDAFILPGAQIYLSRQLVALLPNESDLAALFAYELGQILTHQGAVEFSQAAHQLLGVTDFAAPDGVLDVYGRLADLPTRDLDATQRWKQEDATLREALQEEADRTALYLLAAAGYPAQSMEQLFEQIAQDQKPAGNWLIDLFRFTIPDENRTRALGRSLKGMPASCHRQGAFTPAGDFSAWRDALIAFDRSPRPAQLSNLLAEGRLRPGLPDSVERIRFSPDGRYLLVHNSSGVLVYTTNPLAFQFRIDAPDASHVNFSPDSHSVELYRAGLRFEQWSIFPPKRLSVRIARPLPPCWREAPSPEEHFLALMGCDGTLSIKEESTGQTIFSTNDQGTWQKWAFSPDDRYFFATQSQDMTLIWTAIDLKERRDLSLSESPDFLLAKDDSFGFIDSTRLAVATDGGRSILVIHFPSGKLVGGIDLSRPRSRTKGKDRPLPQAPGATEAAMPKRIARVTKGDDNLLLFPFGNSPAALLDLNKRKLVARFTSPVVDVFDSIAAVQLGSWLKLDDLHTGQILSSIPLPSGVLGPVKAAEVSPDLKWLAISGSQRGGVFRLEDGSLFDETPQFTDAWFDSSHVLYLNFPEPGGDGPGDNGAKATIRRIDLATRSLSARLQSSPDDREYGPWLLAFRKGRGAGEQDSADNLTLEVRALGESKPLWTRSLPGPPSTVRLGPSGATLLFGWPLLPSTQSGHARLQLASGLVRKYVGGVKEAGYGFQIFEAKTGRILRRFFLRGLMEKKAMRVVVAAGDGLVLTDGAVRTQVYSWKTGRREGLALGHSLAVSPDGKFACLGVSPRDLTIARLPSLESTATLKFPRAVFFTRFSADGRRLFVLTRDQHYFVFDVPSLAKQAPKAER